MGFETESRDEIVYHIGTGRASEWDLRDDEEIEEFVEDIFEIN